VTGDPAVCPGRPASRVALGLLAVFVACQIALHLMRPDLDPMRRMLSEYAVGDWGWVFGTSLVMLALTVVSLGVGLRAALAGRFPHDLAACLTIGVVAVLVAAAVPTDVAPGGRFQETITTTAGRIHGIASFVGFLAMTAGAFLLLRTYRLDSRWAPFLGPLRTFTWLLPVALVGSWVGFALAHLGLPQRLLLGVVVAWVGWTAVAIGRVGTTEGE
jgi:hypothetical protein